MYGHFTLRGFAHCVVDLTRCTASWYAAHVLANVPSVCIFGITLVLYDYLTFPQLPCENICFFTHLTFLYCDSLFTLLPYYFYII